MKNHDKDPDFEQVIIGGKGRYKIAILNITGTIVSDEQMPPPGRRTKLQTNAAEFVDMAQIAAHDPTIAGVILHINSPGGEAGASEDIYEAVSEIREQKPIMVFVQNVCASGAYMAAVASHYIAAPPSALVGSIGVIMQHIEISEAMKKFGVKANILATGKFKGAGSLYEPMNEDVKEYLKNEILNETFKRFKDMVFSRRGPKIAEEDKDEITSGKVFCARKAESLGLIDETVKADLSTQYAAITKVIHDNYPHLAEESFVLVEIRRRVSFFDILRAVISQIKLNPLAKISALIDAHSTPGLWYIWLP